MKHTKCVHCKIELTPDVKSARSNHQCVECHIKHPFGIYHDTPVKNEVENNKAISEEVANDYLSKHGGRIAILRSGRLGYQPRIVSADSRILARVNK